MATSIVGHADCGLGQVGVLLIADGGETAHERLAVRGCRREGGREGV